MIKQRKYFLIVALLFCSPLIAIAQSVENAPTDVELKAAYCIGVVNRQIDGICGGNIQLTICKKTESDSLYAHKQRLVGYLYAKGYMDEQKPLLAIASPMSQGEEDANACVATATPDSSTKMLSCFKSCNSEEGCLEKCVKKYEPPACAKLEKCRHLDFLPY